MYRLLIWYSHGCHKQNEAAFLLWFHALDGEDMVEELVGCGVINVCLVVLDNEDATPLDKSCAAGDCASRSNKIKLSVLPDKGRADSWCGFPILNGVGAHFLLE